MNILVDIIVVAMLILGIVVGQKKGLIKTAVGLIGLVAVVIISYTLRVPLANLLIDKMPFFDFNGLPSLSILLYNVIAFVVVFVVLYSILSIILSLTKFVDTLLKLTVIWIIPSKIGGAIIGFLETWVYLFLILFVMVQFNVSAAWVKDTTVAKVILDHTPIVGSFMNESKEAAKDIYKSMDEMSKDETKTQDDINLRILQYEIIHGLVSKEKAQELVETGKVKLDNVLFGKAKELWLNI